MAIQFLRRLKRFIVQSHRSQHIIVGFFVGLVFGVITAVCVGIAFECKDVQHDPRNAKQKFKDWTLKAWDGIDLGLTAVGGLLGNLIQQWVISWFV